MRRLFLAAGVAALAIATPATAKPGGDKGGNGGNPHGDGGGQQQAAQQGGGGGHGHGGGGGGGNPHFQAMPNGGGGGHGHGGGGFAAPQMQAFERGGGHGHGGGGFAAPQTQRFAMPRAEHGPQNRGFERQQMHVQRQAQNRGFERQQMRVQQAQNHGLERQQMRLQREAQNHGFEHQQVRAQQAQNKNLERDQLRAQRFQQLQPQMAGRAFDRQQLRADRMQQFQQQALASRQLANQSFAVGGNAKDFVRAQQQAYQQALTGTAFAPIYYNTPQILAPTVVANFIGVPIQTVGSFASLAPMPLSMQYLYPSTPNYYYQYGDGYAYQVDRGTNLIAQLIPLLAGGYLPGQYLPQPYMSNYVPADYGFNAFYPDYGNTCNRYANGVIYEVDCYSGMVEDVIPMYAGGYGVGQMLPASYAYYNVPSQYRSLYYDTSNSNYWYAPGAIYQYDPGSSMITSVAALLSPGFTVGQPLPTGYDVYNVPYDYRATYYDTPNASYRYSNGYIYQVDPVSQIVTAIVASILT